MPNGEPRYLLDTTVVSAIMNRTNPTVRRQLRDKEVYVSVITLGELRFGVLNSTRPGRHLSHVDTVIAQFELVKCTKGTATHYATIKNKLKQAGRPIPENDIWIAATAIQHNLILLTTDKDFNYVEGLRLEQW